MLERWRRSAAYRIGFAWSAVFAASIAVLGLFVFVAMHLAFRRQIDSMVGDESDELVAEYRTDGLGGLQAAIADRETSRSPERLMYAVYDAAGRRIAGHLAAIPPKAGISNIQFNDPDEGADSARALSTTLSPSVRLVVAADREWLERIDKIVVATFGLAFLVVLLLGVVGGALLGRYLQHRLQAIAGSARRIIAGDTGERIPVGPRRDEFDELAIVLNRMLDRIEMLIENLRQVSSDVAHDLRTPLTKLRNFLSADHAPDDLSAGAIERVDELLLMFGSILRIAEVESGETRRFFETVDLSQLVEELGETYQPSFSETGRELLCLAEPGIHVAGDRQLLNQAAANLLDNAIRHTPEGTIVRLTLTGGNSTATLCVSDNGQGIPAADRSRVTRRFQRLDRSRSTPGFGLGLNLTSAVVALHDGRLSLGDAHPGLEVRIDLPILTEANETEHRE